MRPFNVLATAVEGERGTLIGALRRFGDFGGGGYRNIVVGNVPDVAVLLEQVREALPTEPRLRLALARIIPIEMTLEFAVDDVVEVLSVAAERFLDRLAGGSFYVRLERRGLKGLLHSSDLERAVGEHLWRTLEARGAAPRVDFADPDQIVAIETLGTMAGLGLVSRALREAYPFVRVG
ncbi:MAG: THUMP domain-containing protein [Candidatus Binatia bacterium]